MLSSKKLKKIEKETKRRIEVINRIDAQTNEKIRKALSKVQA